MNAKPLLLAALLGGCATTPHNLQQDLAQSAIPSAWMFQNSDRAANSHREWWRGYGSAALDQLITRGLAHNQNLAAAGYAWQKSRIALENSDVNRGPDYSGGVNASAGRNLSHGGHSNQNYGSSLGINYQADLWGKLRLASDNAAWESQATAEDLLATRLSLIGDIINQYLQIASLNDQLALNAAYRKNAAQTLDLTRTKVHAGSASPLDLREAEQNRTNLDANRDRLENQRQQAETTLASLLGAPVSRVINQEPSLKTLTVPAIDSGIPAHLLAQRPDLRAAQYRLQQNLGNIAIAERDYYPDLTLGANLGTSASRLLELLHNPIGAISANITLPERAQKRTGAPRSRNQLPTKPRQLPANPLPRPRRNPKRHSQPQTKPGRSAPPARTPGAGERHRKPHPHPLPSGRGEPARRTRQRKRHSWRGRKPANQPLRTTHAQPDPAPRPRRQPARQRSRPPAAFPHRTGGRVESVGWGLPHQHGAPKENPAIAGFFVGFIRNHRRAACARERQK